MSSTTETGHARNLAAFEDLISFCTGFGSVYHPSKANLGLTALNPQLAAAQDALQTVKTTKTTFDNATNAREIAIAPMKPLVTRIVNALAATDAAPQTVDDARSLLNKIQGRGRKPKKIITPNTTPLAEGEEPEPAKTVSNSQRSYDNLVDNFAQLIVLLTAEPKYVPNEIELKVATLNTLLTDMKAKNTAVVNAYTAVSNARINRNKLLYGELTGMVDVALAVKIYVKSLFGPTTPQYKQVSGLKFTRLGGN